MSQVASFRVGTIRAIGMERNTRYPLTSFRSSINDVKYERNSKTYTNCIELYVVLGVDAESFIDFQQIEYNWTNGTIYDFFVQESILYEVQQGGIGALTNLVLCFGVNGGREKRERKSC
jgi:hypothetical protein